MSWPRSAPGGDGQPPLRPPAGQGPAALRDPEADALVTDLIADSTTAIARGTTYENRANLAPAFFERIVSQYEGSRLGQQELLAEVLEISDGLWFHRFDAAKHVTEAAEYDPRFPAHLAIDCGVSRHVGAVGSRCGGSTRSSGV